MAALPKRRKGESFKDYMARKRNNPTYRRQVARDTFQSNQLKARRQAERQLLGTKEGTTKKIAGNRKLGIDPIYMRSTEGGHVIASTTGRVGKLFDIEVLTYTRDRRGHESHGRAGVMKASDLQRNYGFKHIPFQGHKASTGRSSG